MSKKASTSNILTIPYNFTPRDYQLALFQAMDGIKGKPGTGKKRAILKWHRRAGKDKSCWCYLIKEAAQKVGNYFYVFPTKTMARQALWENIDKNGFKLLNHVPAEYIARKSNQEMMMELINGSTIRVLGYDKDPDSIRGIATRGIVFSEFAFSDPESYKNTIPILRESGGWAIFNSTPNGRNHFYDMWVSVCNSSRWFVSELQTLWPDKPNYSGLIDYKDIPIISSEEGLTEEDMEREYGVSFSSGMQGAYFADQIESALEHKRIGEFLYDETLEVSTYWDIGIDDTDACWFAQHKGDTVVFIDYFEKNGQGTNDIARMLKDKGYRYKRHYLPHDADHRKKGQEIMTTASALEDSLLAYEVSGMVEVLPRPNNKQASIMATRKRFPNYKFDSVACVEGIRHIEMYHRAYDNRRKVFLQQPRHDEHSHCADALLGEAQAAEGYKYHSVFNGGNTPKVVSDWDVFD